MKYLLIGVIGVFGVFGSIWEYRNWRKEETTNYGQGWQETKALKEPETLVGPYVNELQKYRIRYPKNWNIKEDKQSTIFYLDRKSIRVERVTISMNFPDFVDSEAQNIIRDRDYSDSLVVLTFDGKQKALSQKGNVVYIVTAIAPKENWNEYELTFKEVYKSLVTF